MTTVAPAAVMIGIFANPAADGAELDPARFTVFSTVHVDTVARLASMKSTSAVVFDAL